METSDDPFGWLGDVFGGGDELDTMVVDVKTIDERFKQQQQARNSQENPNRKFGLLTKDWQEPILGQPGLLGIV
jgi:hypothetical protein